METGLNNLDTIRCNTVEITSVQERKANLDKVCGEDGIVCGR